MAKKTYTWRKWLSLVGGGLAGKWLGRLRKGMTEVERTRGASKEKGDEERRLKCAGRGVCGEGTGMGGQQLAITRLCWLRC